MAKFIPDDTFDDMLAVFGTGVEVHVCSSQPTNYTEASTTYNLATQDVDSNDFVIANGTVSGRKSTLTPPTGTSITTSGTATHVAVTTASELLVVTTCTSQALTSGGTVDIGAFALELSDPT